MNYEKREGFIMTQIYVFGDSVGYGAWDKEGGWVARLRKFLDKISMSGKGNLYYMLYNESISGNNTWDLLERFEFEIKQRLRERDRDDIIIFAIGGNDSRYLNKKENLQTTSEQFRENIEKLIKLARKITLKIVFVGITPLDESRTTPISWSPTKYYLMELVVRNNKILREVCKKNKILFIDVFERFLKTNYKKNLLYKDGLHPSTEGHKLIFDVVKDLLIKNKIIKF